MISGARYRILGLTPNCSYGLLTSTDTVVSVGQVRRGGRLAGVRAGGVPHGIEHILGTGRGTLIGRLITCGINLLWPFKIHIYGWGHMYTFVEKSTQNANMEGRVIWTKTRWTQ